MISAFWREKRTVFARFTRIEKENSGLWYAHVAVQGGVQIAEYNIIHTYTTGHCSILRHFSDRPVRTVDFVYCVM